MLPTNLPPTGLDPEIEALAPSERAFLLAASLVRQFKPERLTPLDAGTLSPLTPSDAERRGGLAYVVAHSMPLNLDDPLQFSCTLDDDLRRRALVSFGGLDRIRQAFAHLPAQSKGEREPLRLYFETPSPVPSLDELSDRRQALVWLQSYLDDDHSLAALDGEIERVGLLAPLQRLAGANFVGRLPELNVLRRFIGVLPEEAVATDMNLVRRVGSAVGVAFANVVDWASNLLSSRDVLFVTAPGGMGKSTLLAKLLLDHSAAPEGQRCPFVWLDFDRPSLVSKDPRVLLEEIGRQLEIQTGTRIIRPWIGSASAQATEQALETIEASEVDQAYFLEKQVAQYAREMADALASSPFAQRPLLLVFDTLERVFRRGRHWVAALDDLIGILRDASIDLRAITAGRAFLADIERLGTRKLNWREQTLQALPLPAAEQLLLRRGVPQDQVQRVAEEIGGVPLSLHLAADYLKKAHDDGQLLDATTTRSWLLKRRLSDEVIQGNLYQRLLTHIDDTRVQRLAYPGLVLREVTPTLIKDVLAGPCGLGTITRQEAKQLFDALADEFTLVDEVGRDLLRHRNDVRQVMLAQMLDKDRERARQISEGAVRYYDRLKGPKNAAEAIYHRLLLGDNWTEIEKRWTQGVDDYLGEQVIDEIPSIELRVRVANKLRLEIDDAKWLEQADRATRERRLEQDFQARVRLGQVREALSIVAREPEFAAGSPMYPLIAQAHADVREYVAAMRWVDAGLERIESADGASRSTLLPLYLVRARILETVVKPSPRLVGSEIELLDALWREHPGDPRVTLIALLELEVFQELRIEGTRDLQRWLEARIATARQGSASIDPAIATRILPAFMLGTEERSVALARWLIDLPGVTEALARIVQRFATRSMTFNGLAAKVLLAKLVPFEAPGTGSAKARQSSAAEVLSTDEITAIALAVRLSARETRSELRSTAR